MFYIIEQEVIMAKLIGFNENFRSTRPVFGINKLRSLESYSDRDHVMVHDGPAWSIGYQPEIRYFLDDGTFVDFKNDFKGQVQFLKDYLARGEYVQPRRKLEVSSEVEFMDI